MRKELLIRGELKQIEELVTDKNEAKNSCEYGAHLKHNAELIAEKRVFER